MLEIRSLERVAEEEPPRRRQPWGIRQGLVLLGMLVTVVAACVALGLVSGPQIVTQEYTKRRDAHYRWIGVAAVIGVLGVACAASSLLVPKPGPPHGESRGRRLRA